MPASKSIDCFSLLCALAICFPFAFGGERVAAAELESAFENPPVSARPWTFWYWMHGCVSQEGITADLEAMQQIGLGGAYLMPIKGPADPSPMEDPVVQLTPEWWEMVRHAFEEADRLGLKLAMHACDGFAVAGGPWITPELSMQKVAWSTTYVEGGKSINLKLPLPAINEDYYQEIAVLAFPSLAGSGDSTRPLPSQVTTSLDDKQAGFLASGNSDQRVRMEDPGWILYEYNEPFRCRSITITPDGNNYQAHRLLVQASDDGETFEDVAQLAAPRQGWQNGEGIVTHAIPPTESRYFRFVFDKEGSEPGAEDLDAAKWSPVLKVRGIELSSELRIHQFRSKNGEVWRVSPRTTAKQIADGECIPLDQIVDLSENVNREGQLVWQAPPGKWTILRFVHTSTGTRNETGGGGKGLECDKLRADAVRLQFDRWFGEIPRQIGADLASRVLKIFHVDSWECGSQNWTPAMRREFTRRRGYDPIRYLPAMAGYPVETIERSEGFLYDVRQTVSELLTENFFGTMAKLSAEAGCQFSAECVAPTMLSDGMRHFAEVDFPMGEFWLRSPTHDKPNDMRDAISAARIYGKPIVQAEAFTEIRMNWQEHPGMLKALGDRQYCLGINRFVYHVFTQNPWLDRQPGMTLDNIGLYFQRDQTWWQPGRAWVDYAARCQTLLQQGRPVVDVAIFTGEELPRRALLPEQLVATLPGTVGEEAVERERRRRANRGTPTRELPPGVRHSANISDPTDWLDPLRGYAYDSINRDALLRLARVKNGKLVLPGGMTYSMLVVPASRPLSPAANLMSPEVVARLQEFAQAGLKVVLTEKPEHSPSLADLSDGGDDVDEFLENKNVIQGPIQNEDFTEWGIAPDFLAVAASGEQIANVAWTHRRGEDWDLYFVSNQSDERLRFDASFRIEGKLPEIWAPVTGERRQTKTWHTENQRTVVPLQLTGAESLFLVFRRSTEKRELAEGDNWIVPQHARQIEGPWQVEFDPEWGGPEAPIEFAELVDWSSQTDEGVRYYSGTAVYRNEFTWKHQPGEQPRYWLDLGKVANLASVRVNGIDCGVAWTPPYCVDITNALRSGENQLEIEVTNTWCNRIIGDQRLPEEERFTWTTARFPRGMTLQKAGLLGPVQVITE